MSVPTTAAVARLGGLLVLGSAAFAGAACAFNDPVLEGPFWTTESDLLTAQLGSSVATAGDVNDDGHSDVIIGIPRAARAIAFLGHGSGLSPNPAWTVEPEPSTAEFGFAVAPAGDVNGDGYSDVIVGAPSALAGDDAVGRAYVYVGSATGLSTTPAWVKDGAQDGESFGVSVSTAGDVNGDGYADVIVGAYLYSGGQSGEGRACLYLGSRFGLASTASWSAESNQAEAHFGYSVSTAGDVNADGFDDVIVGAHRYDGGATDEGRAFVFLGSAAGLSPTPAWVGDLDTAGAHFGSSVSGAGDVNGDGYADIVVGAPNYSRGEALEGAAIAYYGSAAGLSTSAAWIVEPNRAGSSFGRSVATAGDVNGDGYADVCVGSPSYSGGGPAEGRATAYLGGPSGLDLAEVWFSAPDQSQAYFGYSVATSGDVNGDGFSDVIVGCPGFDNPLADEGSAFLFLGSGSEPSAMRQWNVELDQASAAVGTSVACAGDVDGDGTSDVIAGAPNHDNGEPDEGRAFVYLGSPRDGLGAVSAWVAEANQATAHFGASVASAGDVNNDGYGDVIVGAPLYDNGQTDEGRAFVYLGSAGGLVSSPAWWAEPDQAQASYGTSVASAGDVNGDGYCDVIVGAPHFDNGETNEGRAFLYLGTPSGPANSPSWTAESDAGGSLFGSSVGSAGDVNGDGFTDVIIGAPLHSNGQPGEGRAFVYLGSPTGMSATPFWTLESNQANAQLGKAVASAGDLNGDGYSDVIVGAPYYSNGQSSEGKVFLFLGGASALVSYGNIELDQAGALFGSAVGSAGDVNGDGDSDVVIGAPYYANGTTGEGGAFVYLGVGLARLAGSEDVARSPAAPLLPPGAIWGVESGQAAAHTGWAVGTAGDVNGDGFSDVVVATPHFDGGQIDEGRVEAFHGNGGAGTDRLARQRWVEGSRPIALLGASESTNAFRLDLRGRSAAGRARVRLEWEVQPTGVPFDGESVTRSGAFDTGSPATGGAVELSAVPMGLELGAAVHWRARAGSSSPFFPRTPWCSVPGNAANEDDVRTAIIALADVDPTTGPMAQKLAAIFPSPFRRSTTIDYVLDRTTIVRLAVYDVRGREQIVLEEGVRTPGRHRVIWEGRTASGTRLDPGVYFVELHAGGRTQSRKVTLAP